MNFQHINPDHTLHIRRGTLMDRLIERSKWIERGYLTGSPTGPYKYRQDADNENHSFYLDSDFSLDMRWEWADEINTSINHTGWFTDEYGDSETIRGIVFTLPHSRGYLYGWSMGEGMATTIRRMVVEDQTDAAQWADQEAEHAAEREREYQSKQDAEQ